MKHFYSEIDNITLTFSDILTNQGGMEYVKIYYERPNQSGFDFVESILPDLDMVKTNGFSEDEIYELEQYARNNAPLIWEIAREDGKQPMVELPKNPGDIWQNKERVRISCTSFLFLLTASRIIFGIVHEITNEINSVDTIFVTFRL